MTLSHSKIVSLMYHDAVENDRFDDSGFPGAGPAIYKLNVHEMEAHFARIAGLNHEPPALVPDIMQGSDSCRIPLVLTFDDGGVSASTLIADLLEARGWRGHFFVTAGLVDRPAFLSSSQVRDLKARGHLIGSHSWSHPARMSSCSREALLDEWQRSISKLSDLTGEQITIASVPGGFYSSKVARAAAASGIHALFTSEPVKTCFVVNGCLVLGRFRVTRGMAPSEVAALCSVPNSRGQIEQYAAWSLKKVAKLAGGKHYPAIRTAIVHLFTRNTNNS